jgi:hypothetical protein
MSKLPTYVLDREFNAPRELVWLHSSSDAKWNIIPSPMMADWPRVLLTTVTLEEAGMKLLAELLAELQA